MEAAQRAKEERLAHEAAAAKAEEERLALAAAEAAQKAEEERLANCAAKEAARGAFNQRGVRRNRAHDGRSKYSAQFPAIRHYLQHSLYQLLLSAMPPLATHTLLASELN